MPSHFLTEAGSSYGDFVVTKYQKIDEIGAVLRELSHKKTGASVMHLETDDPENLFCLSFQTLPDSSNGVPHILEHTVLCGSKAFPVKDPFFAMNRRSLNTFMNALTGSDFTCYPAASQVEKDFYNLLTVYLDAVFHPNLHHLSFLQEGHRFEFTEPTDPKTPLLSKGIVFNEMKGSLASVDNRLWHLLMEKLLPDLPYAFNSGGDPKEIPKLTYEELKSFHQTYYHPSRCLFFFYGNLPLQGHLDFIQKHALTDVTPLSPLPPLPKQTRFNAPVSCTAKYPIAKIDPTENQAIIALCFLTTFSVDQEELLALTVLDSILMDSDASLLKKELLRSGLCIQADAFMDPEMSEVPYAIVCRGCTHGSAPLIESKVKEILKEIAEKGIPFHLIEAAIHQLEIGRLEISGDHSPFGLTLFMRAALAKQHGGSAEHTLVIYSLFEKLSEKMKNPEFIKTLIKKHFLNNTHYVSLTLTPDADLGTEEAKEEILFLKETQKNLKPEEISQILEHTQKLALFQKENEQQSLECLPKITLQDIPPITRDFPLKKTEASSLTFFHHPCFTNHLIYTDLHFDLPHIAEEDLPYAQLFANLISELGCGKRGYEENLEYIQAYTGGVGCALALNLQTDDPKVAKPSFVLKGKALEKNSSHLFSLFYDMLTSPRFDEEKRIAELISQISNADKQRLGRQGMRYAIQLALSGFSDSAHIAEAWQGIRHFHFIQDIHKHSKKNLKEVCSRLSSFKEKLISFAHPELVFSSSLEASSEIKEQASSRLSFPQKEFTPWKGNYTLQPVSSQGRIIPSPVAFSVEAFQTVTYLHRYSPALMVASTLLENTTLHPEIREQGGAYGTGAVYAPHTGIFYFQASRDPHIARTWEKFHLAAEKIASQKFSLQDLEEAKIGIIQRFDSPISPGSRAAAGYSWLRTGRTKELRQQYREALLSLTPKEIAAAVESELLTKQKNAVFVTCADKSLLEKENKILASQGKELPLLEI